MVDTPELMVFFRIFMAHLLADFFLQRRKWVIDKKNGIRSPYHYYHIGIVGLLTYLFLADWSNWQLPLFITVTHFLIDWWKSAQQKSARYFVIDQLLHIAMLVIGWLWYIGYGFVDITILWDAFNNSSFWILVTAYLIILRPLGFLIGKLTRRWSKELNEYSSELIGLKNAGTWIGYVERTIILTFILLGQYSAIGFLIAAKSIFRFTGKITEKKDRMQAEYILIGTLISFLFAILVGLGAKYSLGI